MSSITIGSRAGRVVRLDNDVREMHMHVVGASRQGKSYFLEHLIREDILAGHGVCVIDPHGELYDNVVKWLADFGLHKTRKIHLINPLDGDWTVGFNPLCGSGDDPTVRVDAMVDACVKVWGGADITQTPRLSKCLRLVFFALASHQLSLVEASKLTSWSFRDVREYLTGTLKNQVYTDAWAEFNMGYSQRTFVEMFESTNSRLLAFTGSPIIHDIIGQTENIIDFRQCMDEGHIVLVNLSPKGVPFEHGRALGTMIACDLFATATQRDIDVAKRHPFYFYIDECADYLTHDIAKMLDQTAKFGLHVVLSHQRLAQLKERDELMYEAVMAAAQTKVVFACRDDPTADLLSRHLFRTEFDLDRTKRALDKPTVVGYWPMWLDSESESETVTESVGKSESSGETVSTSTSEHYGDTDEESDGYTDTSGVSETTSSTISSSSALGRTTTEGRSKTLKPILETMPTSTYSLDELIHVGNVKIRSLPKRTAFVQEAGKKPYRMSTLNVQPGIALESTIERFVCQVNEKSAFTTSRALVREAIAFRNERLRELPMLVESIDDDDDDFLG